MTRRIQERPPVIEVPPGVDQPHRHLGWVGPVAFVVVLAAISVAYSLFHQGAATKNHPKSVSSPSASSVPGQGVPGMPATVAGFAALTANEQRILIGQQLDHYNAVLDDAYRNLDPSKLQDALTGPELQTQQQQLQALKAQGKPTGEHGTYTVLGVGAAPALGSVSVQVNATDTTSWLDPTTLQPTGAPNVSTGITTYTFVPEGGVWKVSVVVAQ